MSEAASVDKMMHILDYDRALGELLELDDTIKHATEHLKKLDAFKDTLILVTSDHGHGFDVFGSVDTKYFDAQETDREKRGAIGTYEQSGLSQYVNTGNLRYSDSNFPSNWEPRYTLAQGFGAKPDVRENYRVHKDGPRLPATNITGFESDDYFVNPEDAEGGFVLNGKRSESWKRTPTNIIRRNTAHYREPGRSLVDRCRGIRNGALFRDFRRRVFIY